MTSPSPQTPKQTGRKRSGGRKSTRSRPKANVSPARKRQTTPRESVGALIRRLGTPPSDLADQLVERFSEACERSAAEGRPVTRVDLDDWALDESGSFVRLPVNHDDGESPTEHVQFGPADRSALLDAFRDLLSGPPPSQPTESFAERITKKQRSQGIGSADLFAAHQVEETETSSLSSDEMLRREKLISLFTDSLVDRFGADAVFESPQDEKELSQGLKVKTLERDRKFDWNLVLGVATVAAVIAMVWTGVRLSQLRQERAKLDRMKNDGISAARSVEPASRTTTVTGPVQKDPIELIDLDERPDVADEELFTVKTSMGDLDEARAPLDDVLEDLGEIEPINIASLAPRQDSADAAGSDRDSMMSLREASLKELEKEGGFPEISDDEKSKLGIEALDGGASLEELLSKPGAGTGAEVESNSVPVTAESSRAVALPTLLKAGTETTIADSRLSIQRIEFPNETPISVRVRGEDSPAELINTERNVVVGNVVQGADSTRIVWTENASADSNAMVHGRLMTSEGASVYLRPKLLTNAIAVDFDPQKQRVSLPLQGPILSESTRLELDLSVPDTIDLAWETPFNAARPRSGEAVAILTPKDGETVAVAVMISIDCARSVECRLRLAGRIDESLPWFEFDPQRFMYQAGYLRNYESALNDRISQFERRFRDAGLTEQSFMKRQRQVNKEQMSRLQAIKDRMSLLGILIEELNASVKLNMHLYVNWPDAKQTILVTSNDVPGEIVQ